MFTWSNSDKKLFEKKNKKKIDKNCYNNNKSKNKNKRSKKKKKLN